ncbi:MAG TPA: hypothetical protein VFB45_24540 [Pseudolabrys sp.]|nr:hypothetical protein [Pseudolabrys sp.]
MFRRLSVFAALVSGVLLTTGASAGPWVTGNDTGGIIPYSPANRVLAKDLAGQHCAWYGKYARITSVYAKYGQYIAFSCNFDRRYQRNLRWFWY